MSKTARMTVLTVVVCVFAMAASHAHAGLASSPLGFTKPVCGGLATSPMGVTGPVCRGIATSPLGIAPPVEDGPPIGPWGFMQSPPLGTGAAGGPLDAEYFDFLDALFGN